ncbi:DUF4124 domain-containing protein [Hydrogenophaga borbori]|uniref:DUF4124 domain-containing protein n=2 Tax=Hydrogenophaga borbori TaxID=2294117 RepID=A0A372EFN2_9BURK|nr:DUF4124 domain-containing protein [Hydrogenophaga borbori]
MGAVRWIHLMLTMALALAWGGGIAQAQVYRWKDSNGQIHFGDRPDPERGAKKVVVPRPNLAKGLEVTAPTASAGATHAASDGETDTSTVPAQAAPRPPPEPMPQRGVAAQRHNSCQAKWAAFEASAACFGACGRNNGAERTRNNAGCEHCAETPMPNC